MRRILDELLLVIPDFIVEQTEEYIRICGKLYVIWQKYPNNQLKLKCNLVNSKQHGWCFKWNEDGTISEMTCYTNNRFNYNQKKWHNGILVSDHTDKVCNDYYFNGQKRARYSVICKFNKYDDYIRQLHGPYISWFETGCIDTECTFVNGHIDGLHKMYYSDGKLYKYTHYKHGLQHGTNITYNISSNINLIETFVNGRRHGIHEVYDLTKKDVYMKEIYVHDQKHGIQIYSKLDSVETKEYKNGQQDGVTTIQKHLTNQIITTEYVQNKERGIRSTYYNGILISESYVDSELGILIDL